MALQTAQLTIGTTAVELTGPTTDNRADSAIAVQAPTAATLYVGAADVTVATGWPIAAGQTLALDLQSGEQLYGIIAAGTGTAYVLRTGV